MAACRTIRAELPGGAYLEVGQQDLLRNTESVSQKVAEFLDLGPDDAKTLPRLFQKRRPQETAPGSASKTYSLENPGWSETEQAIFKRHCAAEMEMYGYGAGSEYYR